MLSVTELSQQNLSTSADIIEVELFDNSLRTVTNDAPLWLEDLPSEAQDTIFSLCGLQYLSGTISFTSYQSSALIVALKESVSWERSSKIACEIGVTTNGRGCKLSSRIRREIASSLPLDLGSACLRLGTIRRRIQEEDHLSHLALSGELEEDDSTDQTATFNKLVKEADLDAAKGRRLRWLSQICEYWPLRRLANISDADVESVLKAYATTPSTATSTPLDGTSLDRSPRGRIILAGSGPGHPDLLTRAAHKAILTADVILADKLVPSGVLDLIPRRTLVHIARKFPGNAERAQEELLSLGLAGLKAGKIVLRLKQGDPYIYGRGGEEFEYFRKEGYGDAIRVLPGITSALSAPLLAGIPATQRAISDQVLICTGTGRKGKPTVPPEFVETRTVIFLMALHRITGLVADLTTWDSEDAKVEHEDGRIDERRILWPGSTPCTVIERASCPDQRVIRTTLDFVAVAIEEEGSRPPGLLVVGAACEVLYQADVSRKWIVEEGFKEFECFDSLGVEELSLNRIPQPLLPLPQGLQSNRLLLTPHPGTPDHEIHTALLPQPAEFDARMAQSTFQQSAAGRQLFPASLHARNVHFDAVEQRFDGGFEFGF
ncbi:hypothetical protein B7494_g341 [Chlorociboria aeruginascens]|nr:hypothetical protein B7494_g341 [Chlorociboria aeruginascens]